MSRLDIDVKENLRAVAVTSRPGWNAKKSLRAVVVTSGSDGM